MNIKDFKAGQTVYVELIGDASRGKTPGKCIEEWKITSVGRKYVKAGKLHEKYGILGETIFEYRDSYNRFVEKTDRSVDYILYATKQELEIKFEKEKLLNEIGSFFRDWNKPKNLSIEQLKRIKEVLEEKEVI